MAQWVRCHYHWRRPHFCFGTDLRRFGMPNSRK
jgi:hypothetical protein